MTRCANRHDQRPAFFDVHLADGTVHRRVEVQGSGGTVDCRACALRRIGESARDGWDHLLYPHDRDPDAPASERYIRVDPVDVLDVREAAASEPVQGRLL